MLLHCFCSLEGIDASFYDKNFSIVILMNRKSVYWLLPMCLFFIVIFHNTLFFKGEYAILILKRLVLERGADN